VRARPLDRLELTYRGRDQLDLAGELYLLSRAGLLLTIQPQFERIVATQKDVERLDKRVVPDGSRGRGGVVIPRPFIVSPRIL